ncbi:MAG TPA: site-2 protease family protein [Terriglobales bacterium]|nr:site-2 protease family protein [Terriglobales bacterium]
MEAQIKLGRVRGIEIGLHYSWVIIALLITFSLANYFRTQNPAWSPSTVWLSAITTALLFFAAIVTHELGHSVVAMARGLPVRSVTLFALGGVARIDKDATDAKTEFWVGIAGPITSILIGSLCLGLSRLLGWTPGGSLASPPIAVLVWLGYINLALAAFNMIPGFPLDGGRVLRALLWWGMGNADRATRAAARAGQAVALAFIVMGLLRFFAGSGFGALWMAFVGWFLLDAATASLAERETMALIRGVRVGDVMSRDCLTVSGATSLQSFVDDYLLRSGRRCFVVEEQGQMSGLITANEVRRVERELWTQTTVRDAMRPMSQLRVVSPQTPAADALEFMRREDVNQLPVVSDGKLMGIFSRSELLQLLQARAELRM